MHGPASHGERSLLCNHKEVTGPPCDLVTPLRNLNKASGQEIWAPFPALLSAPKRDILIFLFLSFPIRTLGMML